jgi:hypothetical protein
MNLTKRSGHQQEFYEKGSVSELELYPLQQMMDLIHIMEVILVAMQV